MIDQLLSGHPGVPAVDREDPARTARVLEDLALASPSDRVLASAIRAVEGTLDAVAARGTERGGVRRVQLLAWDPWTLTWLGDELETGREAVLRELRPATGAGAPIRARALARDAAVLEPLTPGLRHGEGWLAAPLPGAVLASQPTSDPGAVARLMGTALVELRRFEQAALWPVTAPEQWRTTDDGVRIVALDLTHRTDPGPVIAQLSRFLRPDDGPENPIFEVLHALEAAPPTTVADAVDAVERALATDLAARRHEVFDRRRRSARADRVARLLDLVQRMRTAVPPPRGRGALGVDLEGETLVAEGRPAELWWGPVGDPARIWSDADGFDAAAARRLLRVRASAPPSERLNSEVDGDAQTADRIGRWVAAALKARTVRLLLEKELEARA